MKCKSLGPHGIRCELDIGHKGPCASFAKTILPIPNNKIKFVYLALCIITATFAGITISEGAHFQAALIILLSAVQGWVAVMYDRATLIRTAKHGKIGQCQP